MKSTRYFLAALSLTLLPNLSNATDLAVEKSVDKTMAVPGDTLTYAIAVGIGSSGTVGPSNATVTDDVPAGLSIVSAVWTKDNLGARTDGDCIINGQNVSCDLGTFDAGITGVVTVVVVAQILGIKLNTAKVSGSIPDPQDSNDSSFVESTIVDELADVFPRVRFQQTQPSSFEPAPFIPKGSLFQYNVSVRNVGPSVASNVELEHQLPLFHDFADGLVRIAGSDIGGVSCFRDSIPPDCTNELDKITCRVPELSPFGSRELFCVWAVVKLQGSWSYTFDASSASPVDPVLTNNEISYSLSTDARSISTQNVNLTDTAVDVDHNMGQKRTLEAMTSTGSECLADDQTLCLDGDRFQVQMDWKVPQTDDILATLTEEIDAGGYYYVYNGQADAFLQERDLDDTAFYFFNNSNIDVLVRILDDGASGTAPPDQFWVFSAADTNVEYTIEIEDTATGEKSFYRSMGRDGLLVIEEGGGKNGQVLSLSGFDTYGNMIPLIRTVSSEESEIPGNEVKVFEAYPNPFNSATTIALEIEREQEIEVQVFDLVGRSITVLQGASLDSGFHNFIWDGRGEDGELATSGVYILRVKGADFELFRNLVLTR